MLFRKISQKIETKISNFKKVTNVSDIMNLNDDVKYTVEKRVFSWLIITNNIGKYQNTNLSNMGKCRIASQQFAAILITSPTPLGGGKICVPGFLHSFTHVLFESKRTHWLPDVKYFSFIFSYHITLIPISRSCNCVSNLTLNHQSIKEHIHFNNY